MSEISIAPSVASKVKAVFDSELSVMPPAVTDCSVPSLTFHAAEPLTDFTVTNACVMVTVSSPCTRGVMVIFPPLLSMSELEVLLVTLPVKESVKPGMVRLWSAAVVLPVV